MGKLIITPPIYLLTGKERCYRCGQTVPVVALASKTYEDCEDEPATGTGREAEPILIHDVTNLPDPLLNSIREIHPHYEKRRSKMAGQEYFMNICSRCGSHFGDFFLFSEPGHAFFPLDEKAEAEISIRRLKLSGSVELDANYSMGLGAGIFERAKVIA